MNNIDSRKSHSQAIAAVNKTADSSAFGEDIASYIAAAFLSDIDQVEEWRYPAGSRRDFHLVDGAYRNGLIVRYVDRAQSDRRTKASAIHVRHVLEHHYDWEQILADAVTSAEHKLCVCLSTPFADTTIEIAGNNVAGAPLLSLPKERIEEHLAGFHWKLMEGIQGDSASRQESVYLAWKSADTIRDRMEVELRQQKLANRVLARERDLLLAANAAKRAPESSFGEEVLVGFYRKYLRRHVGRCRKLILGR